MLTRSYTKGNHRVNQSAPQVNDLFQTHSYPASEDGIWFEFLSRFSAGQRRDNELLRDVGSAIDAAVIHAVNKQWSALDHFLMLHMHSPVKF